MRGGLRRRCGRCATARGIRLFFLFFVLDLAGGDLRAREPVAAAAVEVAVVPHQQRGFLLEHHLLGEHAEEDRLVGIEHLGEHHRLSIDGGDDASGPAEALDLVPFEAVVVGVVAVVRHPREIARATLPVDELVAGVVIDFETRQDHPAVGLEVERRALAQRAEHHRVDVRLGSGRSPHTKSDDRLAAGVHHAADHRPRPTRYAVASAARVNQTAAPGLRASSRETAA